MIQLTLLMAIFIASASSAAKYKKPAAGEIKSKLSKEQFYVTQKDGTETPFKNEYWNTKESGIYVDIVSGEPLFSSADKYDSGTGWPSFTKTIAVGSVTLKSDDTLFTKRTEVRSKIADSHLGHVFDDGPPPTGKRFCMNSAAMRFVPLANMAKEGYAELVPLVQGEKVTTELATFAGGCFWCMEPPFEKLDGVISVVSGFSGGTVANPTYQQASSGTTGHTEVVQITFDPKKISYEKLLSVFWRNMDPTDSDGQFVDRGQQYRSSIFYHSSEQKMAAEKSKQELEASKRFAKPVVTPIVPFDKFYAAEDYHQDYYRKSALKYKYYRYRSGRDQFLEKHWGRGG